MISINEDDGERVMGFINSKSVSFKIGIALASVHTILLMYVLYLIIFANEPDWPMYWMLFMGLDLPVSLINVLIPYTHASLSFLPPPFDDINNFWKHFLVTAVFGTLWYFMVPILIGKLFHKIDRYLYGKTKNPGR